MIHVLCLNPAVDKFYAIEGFAAGGVFPGQTPRVSAGGKGVNVARALSLLGGAPRLYALLGEDGGVIEGDMRPRCECVFIPVPGACRASVNIIDPGTGRETVVSESGPRVTQAHVDRLLGALGDALSPGDIVCCSGSIIAGAPADVYARVSRLCDAAGARCALDCNAAALATSLPGARYALGKPNEEELCAHLGERPTRDARAVAALAARLMPPYGALLVSLGAQGGVLVTARGALWGRPPKLSARSTVGCGDACFAGALLAMAQNLPDAQTLRLAMACGAANALADAPCALDMETVRGMEREIVIEGV